jgi:hypothetical protein
MKLGTQVGNLDSWVQVHSAQPVPKIGEGATVILWTDRYAGTITKVSPCRIHVQRDIVVREDTRGMSESQEYTYSPDPEGATYIFRKTKRGWTCGSFGLLIGERDEYYDYSF